LCAVAAAQGGAEQPTFVPPVGLHGDRNTKCEQEGDVRAGSAGLAGTATTALDWVDAAGGPLLVDNATFVGMPHFPLQTSHRWIVGTTWNAVLVRDPNTGYNADPAVGIGEDTTLFKPLVNFDDNPIGAGQDPWTWGRVSEEAAKYDLTNVGLASFDDDCGHRWVLLSVETRSTLGDLQVVLELNQQGIVSVQTAGAFTPQEEDDEGLLIGNGPHDGRTVGDLPVSCCLTVGGSQCDLLVDRWVEGPPGTFTWSRQSLPVYDCDLDPLTTDDQDHDGVPGPDVTGYVRSVETGGPPTIPGAFWKHFAFDGSTTDDLLPLQLVEVALDLTALGLEQGFCHATTAMVRTRSSPSMSSAVRDFTLFPFPLGPPHVTLAGPTAVCAGSASDFEVTFDGAGQVSWTLSGDASFCDPPGPSDRVVSVCAESMPGGSYSLTASVTDASGCTSEPVEHPVTVLDCGWADLGHALAGTTGVPSLVGQGPLTGGSPLSLTLGNAVPSSDATLVVGTTPLEAPFKGGVLVPAPLLLLLGLPTGSQGDLALNGTWPYGLPSGFSTWYQMWIADAAGPAGFSASNGLRATTP
jgi:hypothetical protein